MLLVILGMVSIAYGLIIFAARSGSMFWIAWEIIGALLVAWAMLIRQGFFDRHKMIKGVGIALLIVGILLVGSICRLLLSEFTATGRKKLDYIIVLGAQVWEDGPSRVLRYRLDAAIEYLEENPDTICIVSGGQGSNEPFTEAEGMARYLTNNGIGKERIYMENTSTTTVENIRNSRALMTNDYDGVGIVTNNFHVYRALRIARAQGLENVYGIAAESNKLFLLNNMLRECCAVLKNWILRYI